MDHRVRKSRSGFLRFLIWFIIAGQIASGPSCADTKVLNKASAAVLAPPSVFSRSSPGDRPHDFKRAVISELAARSIPREAPADYADGLARLCAADTIEGYRRFAEHERRVMNQDEGYWEIYYDKILPKLIAAREAHEKRGEPSVLTFGITGSAASGKTTIAERLKRKLAENFANVRIILFDDWLLQAKDRPIDPLTGKTTEDVFKKFEVDKFTRSIKSFIMGQGLLKPVYGQTAKGNVKLTLDDKNRPVILFGPKRKVVIIDTPRGVMFSVQDEEGNVLETADDVTLFDIPFKIEDAQAKALSGELVLNMLDTRIMIGAADKKGDRAIQIIDRNGAAVKNLTDSDTGELIAESGVVLGKDGHIDGNGIFRNEPWKVKEYIPYEDGVFMVEGILSLYDKPGRPKGESLPELYTTSMFVDSDFEVRLERGYARERSRAERLKGVPMSSEEAQKYIGVFTQRKESLEDPFIYETRRCAEFVTATRTRAEGVFHLYRIGRILSERFKPLLERMGLGVRELRDEFDRIEEDFILDALRKSTVRGALKFERKAEGPNYNIYFLKDKIAIKVPRVKHDFENMDFLKSMAGGVMVPGMVIDLSELDIRAEGTRLSNVLFQNEITVLDTLLSDSAAKKGRYLLDRFFELQKNMWSLGIVDMRPRLDRYGSMITDEGKPTVLLFAVDNIGRDIDSFDPDRLARLADNVPPDMRDHFKEGVDRLRAFMTPENFGSQIAAARALPRLYHPEISSRQIDYITSLLLNYKAHQLWTLFTSIDIPQGASPEVVWTRLWIDCIAEYTPEVKEALEIFYKELLLDPDIVGKSKTHALRDNIIKASMPLSRQDLAQINKFLSYLCVIPLEMVKIGQEDGEVKSTLKIKKDAYGRMDPRDREDLCNLLSNPGPNRLEEIINTSEGRIGIGYYDSVAGEGRTLYMALRKPIRIGGKDIKVLRIKGAMPVVVADGVNVKGYKGLGSVSRVMESYSSGAIIVRPGYLDPWGTMLYSEALTEYELMERFNGSKCDTDTAVGLGRYGNLRYRNKRAGYVICGMREADYRLGFAIENTEAINADSFSMKNMLTGSSADIADKLPRFYEQLGASIRYFHDQGFSHRWPHIGNIGMRFDEAGCLSPILRDLNDARDISGNSLTERAADRFLDVSRIVYDALRKWEYEKAAGGKYELKRKPFPNLAVAFLEGYFHELDAFSDEFKLLRDEVMNGDFVRQLNRFINAAEANRLDYEELDEANPYFGKLTARLRMTEETTPRMSSSGLRVNDGFGKSWPLWNETPKEKRVLVMVSGGDCAGLNSFIGYLGAELKSYGMALAGVKNGLEGLTKPDINNFIIPVEEEAASKMPFWSSVEFGSSRKNLREGTPEMEQALSNIIGNCAAVVIIGGNDHLNEAIRLSPLLKEKGVTVIGVPKTIDNDTLNTTALGVASSSAIVLEQAYRSAALPGSGKCVIVEVMGRDMGSLAVSAGNRYPDNFERLSIPLKRKIEYSRPTVMILVPEHPLAIDDVLNQAREIMTRYNGLTVVAAEGFKISKNDPKFPMLVENNPILAAAIKEAKEDDHHNIIISPGITAEFIAEILKELNPTLEVFGFTPRGVLPTDEERSFAKSCAKLTAKAITEKTTGVGTASSDLYADKDKGIAKLVSLDTIAGKTPGGKSLAKTLDQIYKKEDLIKAGVVVEAGQAVEDIKAAGAPYQPSVKCRSAVVKAALSTFKSAWAHKRPSIFCMNGSDADETVYGLKGILENVSEEGLKHDYLLVKNSVMLLTGKKYESVTDFINSAYEINSKEGYLNVVLSGKFMISRKDALLLSLSSKSEELAARLRTAEKRSGNSEYYVFDDNLKELAQIIKLVLLNAEPPAAEWKKMTDVRLTAMDLSLNALPGEEDAKVAEIRMRAINGIDMSLKAQMDESKIICHIIDSSLIPEEQAALITRINKLTRPNNVKEKVMVGNRGESVENTIARVLAKYPNAVIDAAVSDRAAQEKLAKGNILSLVFETEEGPCNFRQLEGIIASLRALERRDKEALLKLYELLTGIAFNGSMPEDLRELTRKLVFKLPAIEIKDFGELKRLNDNLLSLIQAA